MLPPLCSGFLATGKHRYGGWDHMKVGSALHMAPGGIWCEYGDSLASTFWAWMFPWDLGKTDLGTKPKGQEPVFHSADGEIQVQSRYWITVAETDKISQLYSVCFFKRPFQLELFNVWLFWKRFFFHWFSISLSWEPLCLCSLESIPLTEILCLFRV